jgi:hypothetical protein
MVTLIFGLLMFEGSNFIRQPVIKCKPWGNPILWNAIVFHLSIQLIQLLNLYLVATLTGLGAG